MLLAKAAKYRWVHLAVTLLCLTSLGCQDWFRSKPKSGEEDEPRTVYALGHLKPDTGVIDIRATPGDRLKELVDEVEENKLIPADGILGTLDSYDMGRAQLLALVQKKQLALQKYKHQQQLAAAQLAQAKASKAQAVAKQQEVCLQEARLAVLKKAVELEQKGYDKLEELQNEDADLVSDYQLAKQQNKIDMAAQDYRVAKKSYKTTQDAAKAAVEAAESSRKVAELANTQAGKDFDTQLETQLINQEIEIAEEALKRSVLLAPKYSKHALEELITVKIPGDTEEPTQEDSEEYEEAAAQKSRYTALRIFSNDGEIVTQAPIMQLADLSTMKCVAEVYEGDRKELFLGQEVVIRSPAFSGYFADGELKEDEKSEGEERRSGGIIGKVTQIGRMIAPPGLPNRNPLAPTDRSVVEVEIEIDAEANQKAIAKAKEALKAKGKKLDKKWEEDANEMAAKHVGLQVTIEFTSKKQQASKAKSKANTEQAQAAK